MPAVGPEHQRGYGRRVQVAIWSIHEILGGEMTASSAGLSGWGRPHRPHSRCHRWKKLDAISKGMERRPGGGPEKSLGVD